MDEYNRIMDEMRGATPAKTSEGESESDGGGDGNNGDGTYPPGWFNETEKEEEGGSGMDVTRPASSSEASKPSGSSDYIEGSEMTVETSKDFSTGLSFSGAPMIGMVLVIALMVVIYWGYRRRY
jgi:cobalamin biosynthesis Mg chelatase CobN